MKKIILAALAIATLFTACKKDEEEKPHTIVGSWKVVDAYCNPAINYNGTVTTQLFLLIYSDACQRDDILTFTDDNTVYADNGPLKCDTSWAQVDTGTYTLSNGNLSVLLNGAPIPTQFINVEADEDYMYLNQPSYIDSVATYFTLKLKRQ
jgi:hypothetical protein